MESTEFDASLGGTEHLPHTANSFKFAASRSVEITAMTESIVRNFKGKLIFQSLPVHMRRRVMSHNCKRLPRRLREGHLEQLKKSNTPLKQNIKRPSRKYRRRPANLLEEYTRRQRRIAWLETHIWHAKRFHMVERWGYKLAHRPCDKAFRACYRASSAHCLLQDISYFVPIHIQGPIEGIGKMFSYITNKSCGLSIIAKAYTSGNRAGCLNIFKPHSYPFNFIGKIDFLWIKPTTKPELIIFVHPSQVQQVELLFAELIAGSDGAVNKENKKLKLTNELSDIKYQLLYGRFNRFRLTGPNSHAVLSHSLKCVTNIATIATNEWVSEFIKSDHLQLEDKSKYWLDIKNISSPSQLPPRIIIGLIVKDPRWSRPLKRTKARLEDISNVSQEIMTNVPHFASSSPIWEKEIGDIVKKNAITNAKFIEHVTKTHVVPGEINEDDPALQSIPVVLIQQPGSQNADYKKIGYGSGWDIITPSGYALPFWLTFVMFGARTGGLRETENMAHESGECYFSPDSEAGLLEYKRQEMQIREQYFKRPPSKRVNYIKLGISHPFTCPWKILLKDWGNNVPDKYFVLRDRHIINELKEAVHRKKAIISEDFQHNNSCLVAVYLLIEGKGVVRDNAIICLPNAEDINSNKLLCEPQHEDKNVKLRKQKRQEHRRLLRQLRRKRLKLKKKTEIIKEKQPKVKKTEPSEYVKSMRELWVPSDINSVRYECTRQTIGYVTKGAFSFTEAKGCATGYIALNALKTLLENKMNKVLIRNTTSRKYKVANLQIINNP